MGRQKFPLPIANCAFPITQSPNTQSPMLFRFLVPSVLPTVPAVLAELKTLGCLLPILRRAVVPALTSRTRQGNDVSHTTGSRPQASDSGPEARSLQPEAVIRRYP